jgi:hypothetical protein
MSLSLGEMEWVRPKAWKMDWELRRGGEVIARMASPSFFGTTVRASLGDEHYVNRKGGLRRPGAAIARLGVSGDIARLELDSLDRGTVVVNDSTVFRWERKDPSGTWVMSRDDGTALFSVFRDAQSRYPSGKVKILAEDDSTGILLLLAWFVVSTAEC